MGSFSSKLTIPTIKLVKSLPTFQEYPGCTLNQIFEAYGYWVNSEFSRKGTLFPNEFEEVFGQLFPDPIIHFEKLQDKSMGCCVTMDIFYLLIILSDASMEDKIKSIYEMNNKDAKILMRLDAIQAMLYKILSSLKLVFYLDIPSKDEIYNFLEYSFKQFVERTHFNDNEPITVNNNNNNRRDSSANPQPAAMNTIITTQNTSLTFKEIWQWGQDVYQVSSFLEAINEICLTITDSIDRTHKGKQWVLRNSFFSSHSFKLNTNVNIRNSLRFNSFSPKAASNDLLFNILQEVTNKFNAMENNFFTNYSYQKRHPLWNYTINNLVDHDRWFNTIPVCYTDQKVFTGLEHMILSRQKSLLILHRNFDLVRGGGGGPSSANGGNRFNNSSNTSLIPPLSLGSATSNNNNNNNNSNSNPNSMRRQSSSHQFLPHPPSSATGGNRPSTHNLHGHRLSAIGSSFSNGLTGKIELFGVLDYGSILAYMIDSAPSIVFREIKKQERLNRSKRLSFEFSLHRNDSEDGGFDSMDGDESEDYGGDSLSRKPSSINRAGSLDLTIDTENLENGSDNEMTSDNENNPSNNNNNNNNNALFLSNIIEEGDDEDDEDNLSTVSNFKNSVAAAVANFSTNNGRGSLRSSKTIGTRQSGLNASTAAGGGGTSSGDDKKTPRTTPTSKPSTANTNANNANNNNKPQQQQRRRSMKINTSVSLQTNKWHVMGDLVANSNLEKVFYTKSFASFHAKYDVSNCLTTDQFLYNLILLYAKGIRHFPITLEGNNFYKIFHILSSHEIASFLYENYFDIFMNLHQPQPNKIMTADNDHGGFPDSPKNKKVRSSSQPQGQGQGQGSPSPGQSPEKPAHKQKDHSLVDRPIMWSGLMRNPSFVCSISAPSTTKNNNPSPLKSSRPNSPRNQQQANNNNNNQNSASSLNPQPSSSKTTTLEANKAKIRYNLGSIFHQLLASNYDSILITNEKNKVISVVSIHLIEEFWWAWKKRSTVTSPLHLTSPLHGQQPPSSLQMEDVIKEYELGTYQLFDEEPPQVAISNPIGGGNQPSSNNNNKPGSAFTAAVSAVIGGHRLSGNSNATLGVSGNPMPPNNKTPGSSFIQQHRGSQQPGTMAGLTPSSVTGPPSKFSFSNPSASSADLGTPYPFQQNQLNQNPALNTNGTANTANSNNNPSGQNFTFFSILVNYLDQLKDLLNIPILDYDEHLKSPEEIEQERLEREKAKLNSRQKSSPTKGRTATPKTPKNKPAAAAAAPAPGAAGVEESKNIDGKDVPAPPAQAQPSRDSPLTLPVPTTPAKPAAAAAGEGSPKAKVNKGKKGKGGKVVKKWGNFTSYAAFQQHLQREKEKEESKKKADRTRRLEDWFRQLKVLAPHDTLQAALYVMSVTQCNCAHVVSMTGEPLGMVTLQDICKYLVLQEAKQKITMSEFMAHHAHHAHFSQSPVSHLQSSHGVNNNFPIFSNGNDHSPTREILQSKKI